MQGATLVIRIHIFRLQVPEELFDKPDHAYPILVPETPETSFLQWVKPRVVLKPVRFYIPQGSVTPFTHRGVVSCRDFGRQRQALLL